MAKLARINFERMFGRSKERRRRMEKLNLEVVKLEIPTYSKFIQLWTPCFGILGVWTWEDSKVCGNGFVS